MVIFAKFRNAIQVNTQEISKLPFFFIIGRPRSGTTLLRTMLDAHPNVCIPQESPVILNLNNKYRRKTVWDRKDLKSFYSDLESQHIFGVWNIDKEKLKNDFKSCEGENTFQNLIKILYLNFNSIYSKEEIEIIGDKNPIYSVNFPEVFPIFENAKYIHLTRDYRDQIVSMKKMDFEMSNSALVAYRWRLSKSEVEEYREQYPSRFYVLKYEDLVSDPEKKIKELCDFLEVPFTYEMLEFHSNKGTDFLPEETMKKYHTSLFNPIHKGKIETWKSKLTENEVKVADWVVGTKAENAGYKRKYKSISFGLKLKSLPFLLYGRIWNLGLHFMNRLPLRGNTMLRSITYLPPVIVFRMKQLFNSNSDD